MVTKTYKSKVRIATGVTDAFTFPDNMKGELKKIEIRVSASTDFKIYTLQDNGTSVNEYIIGSGAATLTVATATQLAPGVPYTKFDGSAWNAASNTSFVIGRNQVKVDASSLTADDTWSVDLTVRE